MITTIDLLDPGFPHQPQRLASFGTRMERSDVCERITTETRPPRTSCPSEGLTMPVTAGSKPGAEADDATREEGQAKAAATSIAPITTDVTAQGRNLCVSGTPLSDQRSGRPTPLGKGRGTTDATLCQAIGKRQPTTALRS